MTPELNWTAISAVGTMVAAIAAAVSLIQFRRDYYRKLRADRPGFRARDSELREFGDGYRFDFRIMNYGGRVAEDVVFEMELVSQDLTDSLGGDQAPIPDDLPPAEKTFPLTIEVSTLARNMPPHFLFAGIQYRDGLLGTTHHQTWLRKWPGVENGFTETGFDRLTDPDEVEQARAYFRPRIERLKPSVDLPPHFGWSLGVGVLAALCTGREEG